ncbi:oligosaccharide flippase family protein [Geomonas paludis]|uniref:Membrane protein n=1 Tax=Geomonas paludis TaxID=2740185 RepID=A0A6V8N0S7_9BACT|nr:oligosaccharide flippase family protein [Geomonas paludis]UPU36772.1 oligosaccharide flippase family protein [Geomonas paludis]GFO66052.1 membrane protein [Geomonas paludis]
MTTAASLKKRFGFKLVANVIGVLLGVVTMAFVPRALGPEQFGRFEFITNNFKLIFDTLALQVPVAYFNWVSRKGHKEDTDLSSGVTLYFSLGITLLFGLFIAVTEVAGVNTLLWPQVPPVYLWDAFAFTVTVFLYQFLVYLSDGKSLTVGLEKIRLLQNVLKCLVLVSLVLFGMMSLHAYFWAQVVVVGGTVVLSALWLNRQGAWRAPALKPWEFPREEVKRYLQFVLEYARPLTLLMLSGFLFLYFDRWFLQLIGGSAQQGFFGLSDRLGQIAFIFTSAMTPLLTREFALAHEEQDRGRLLGLFERIRLFLFIATVTSCFLSVQSETIVALVGGTKFSGAVVPIALMALYPIHQTFGQLSGSLMVATGQTWLYARIGIIMMVVSLPITYVCIAPASYPVPGLALGASGLALKMLIWQFVGTNVQLYCNTRYLGIRFTKWIGIQIALITTVYALAYGSRLATATCNISALVQMVPLPPLSEAVVTLCARLILSGIVYLIAVALLLLLVPGIAGLSREEIKLGRFQLVRK